MNIEERNKELLDKIKQKKDDPELTRQLLEELFTHPKEKEMDERVLRGRST